MVQTVLAPTRTSRIIDKSEQELRQFVPYLFSSLVMCLAKFEVIQHNLLPVVFACTVWSDAASLHNIQGIVARGI